VSGSGPLAYGISATFSDPTGRYSAHVDMSAATDFGNIRGAGGPFNDETVEAIYQGSFTDSVTVLGGSGAGTLITHYHLISSDLQMHLPGLAFPPFYVFAQGDVAEPSAKPRPLLRPSGGTL
jgi:hypothetical protein